MWVNMAVAKWESKLLLKLRALRNQKDHGIMVLIFNPRQVAVVDEHRGLELLQELQQPNTTDS